jgi:hypothetical protein|tara:strand:+ start:231 stop:332 length:102 start_codon:yes stop_codon:yes gene_type:complete
MHHVLGNLEASIEDLAVAIELGSSQNMVAGNIR